MKRVQDSAHLTSGPQSRPVFVRTIAATVAVLLNRTRPRRVVVARLDAEQGGNLGGTTVA
jgi:hypothetical protein